MSSHLKRTEPSAWTIAEAENLLASLSGVLSARIVARPGGSVEEIHVLTTEAVSPKQTVRNVESALVAHFGLALDHRKISVAQTSRPDPSGAAPSRSGTHSSTAVVVEGEALRAEDRILFRAHRVESETAHRIRVNVSIQWQGRLHQGLASGADLPRSRLEATANATLRAIEEAVVGTSAGGEPASDVALALEGVRVVEAFDRMFALVAVNGMTGRDIIPLSGAASVEENPDRSVVLATLQATDRWVRGKIH